MSRLAVNPLGSRVCQGYVAGSDRDNAFHEVNYYSQRPVGVSLLAPCHDPPFHHLLLPDRYERVTPRKRDSLCASISCHFVRIRTTESVFLKSRYNRPERKSKSKRRKNQIFHIVHATLRFRENRLIKFELSLEIW